MRWLFYLTMAFFAAGCAERTSDPNLPIPATDLGIVVAQVGPLPIYARQVEHVAREKNQAPREALGSIVEILLLGQWIKNAGLGPVVEEKDVWVQRLIARDLEPSLVPSQIPEAELRGLYEKAKDAFVHPRLVEIGLLAIYTGERMKPEPKARRMQVAYELRDHLLQHPPKSLEEFSTVAQDPRWKDRNVIYSRTLQGPDKPLSAKVAKTILRLKAEAETTPMLEDESGFFIARFIGERPPRNTSFNEAQEELRSRYIEPYRPKRFLEFSQALMRDHAVEIHTLTPSLAKGP